MRKPLLSRGLLMLLATFAICLLGLPMFGPMSGHTSAQGTQTGVPQVPMFHDWSMRHVVYVRFGPMMAMQAAAQDPRAAFSWRRFGGFNGGLFGSGGTEPGGWGEYRWTRTGMHRDWSINLGTAGTAPAMYPAKFTFDVTATPSCANDFVTFPINAKGSGSQPNIVAFNNLYSGTAGSTGVCNRTPSGSDTGTAATVLWSYNIQSIAGGGAIATSPTISYDPLNPTGTNTGTKIAFVESMSGSPAHFHVLAWKNGDGQNTGNLQSVLTPKTITTFVTTAPAVGSGTATDLSLGSSTTGTDTLSSPFVDYVRDVAYVGNDIGQLYRIKDVFCTSVNSDCTGTTKPAPSIDGSWGSGGVVTVCTGELTAPILDFVTLNVYVGCSDGKLYSVSQAGAIKSLTVGDGVASKTYGGIVDPPVVDGVNGFVYAVSGSASNGANGVLVQAKTDLSSSVAVPIGAGNQCNLHSPVFNNIYYSSPTATGARIYLGGVTGTVGPCTATGATGGNLEVYATTFGAGGVIKSGAPANSLNVGSPGNEFAPMAEFYNPNIGTGSDMLFFAVLCTGADMASYNITNGFPSAFASGPVAEGFGTSGMIVDNSALTTAGNFPQASSIYFNALGENAACTANTGTNTTPGSNGCAVKLTQAALQ